MGGQISRQIGGLPKIGGGGWACCGVASFPAPRPLTGSTQCWPWAHALPTGSIRRWPTKPLRVGRVAGIAGQYFRSPRAPDGQLRKKSFRVPASAGPSLRAACHTFREAVRPHAQRGPRGTPVFSSETGRLCGLPLARPRAREASLAL